MLDLIQDGDRLRIVTRMGGSGGARFVRQAGLVAVGLALGVGAVAVFGGDDRPAYRPGTASVTAFSFSMSVPEAPPRVPVAVPSLLAEPADAEAAAVAFMRPFADGRPELAYPLLDEPSRRRFPTVASWIRAQPDRPTPLAAIEADLGLVDDARAHLGRALATNLYLSVRDRPAADELAARLGQSR